MKQKTTTIQNYLFLTGLSIVMSLFTLFLGAPFLRVLRKTFGGWTYWITGLVFVTALWLGQYKFNSVLLGSLWMTLGLYQEFELKGFRWASSALAGVSAGLSLFLSGMFIYFQQLGFNKWSSIRDLVIEKITTQLQTILTGVKLDPDIIIQQIPSLVICFLIFGLGFGLIFEKKVFSWMSIPRERTVSQIKLLEFKLPDAFIWIALVSFALTLLQSSMSTISILGMNFLNVSLALYFFQGVAVLEVFLKSLKTGVFMRILVYLILVGQLFLILSLVGLIDYWVDFRKRISKLGKKAAENN